MSEADTKTRRKAENIIRNLQVEADKLKNTIPRLSGDKKVAAEKKRAKILEAIVEREEKTAAKIIKKAANNAAKATAKAEANSKKAANKNAGLKTRRRTPNEIARNKFVEAEAARRRAELLANKKEKAAINALEKAGKKEEKAAYKGLSSMFGNENGFANNGAKTSGPKPYAQFVKHVAASYKSSGKKIKNGQTLLGAIANFKKANPDRYANYLRNKNEFNASNVMNYINSYNGNTKKVTSVDNLRKKLQKTQKKCAEVIGELESQIRELNASSVVNAAGAPIKPFNPFNDF